ncbi:MAG: class I SAM-dependent methyltransferase [Candidatus Hydrogenedentes bacterium]|nr:class I SAM-dependent methyltransferase [Candidatus Hydrogenedentota bacterium]
MMQDKDIAVCQDTVRQMYASEKEIEKYCERATAGLLDWEDAIIGKYFPSPPQPVLDVGCGAGREAFALQELGYDVTAVDISEELLRAARSKSNEQGRPITFLHCDGKHLNFDDDSFACVLIPSQVMGNIPGASSRLEFLREAWRVLRADGIVVFCGHNRSIAEQLAHQEGVVHASAGLEDGDLIWSESDSGAPCYWHYFTTEEVTVLCESAGFRVLTCCLASELIEGGWDTIILCACAKSGRVSTVAS